MKANSCPHKHQNQQSACISSLTKQVRTTCISALQSTFLCHMFALQLHQAIVRLPLNLKTLPNTCCTPLDKSPRNHNHNPAPADIVSIKICVKTENVIYSRINQEAANLSVPDVHTNSRNKSLFKHWILLNWRCIPWNFLDSCITLCFLFALTLFCEALAP